MRTVRLFPGWIGCFLILLLVSLACANWVSVLLAEESRARLGTAGVVSARLATGLEPTDQSAGGVIKTLDLADPNPWPLLAKTGRARVLCTANSTEGSRHISQSRRGRVRFSEWVANTSHLFQTELVRAYANLAQAIVLHTYGARVSLPGTLAVP